MTKTRALIGALPLLLAAAACPAIAAGCRVVPIRGTGDPSRFDVGRFTVTMTDGAPPSSPGDTWVWDGPIEVLDRERGSRCRMGEGGLYLPPIAAFEGNLLVVPSISGSATWVTTFDLARCAAVHESRPPGEQRATFEGGVVRIGRQVPRGMPCDHAALRRARP